MLIKGCLDEDFVNYKKSNMFIICPFCDFKCDKENGVQTCQNWSLSKQPDLDIPVERLVERFLSNPISEAVVFGGLEPMKSFEDVLKFISLLRESSDAYVVIFTGYEPEEIQEEINLLKQHKNIILKFGRFRPNQNPHFDEVLGIKLASDNQRAVQIS